MIFRKIKETRVSLLSWPLSVTVQPLSHVLLSSDAFQYHFSETQQTAGFFSRAIIFLDSCTSSSGQDPAGSARICCLTGQGHKIPPGLNSVMDILYHYIENTLSGPSQDVNNLTTSLPRSFCARNQSLLEEAIFTLS